MQPTRLVLHSAIYKTSFVNRKKIYALHHQDQSYLIAFLCLSIERSDGKNSPCLTIT